MSWFLQIKALLLVTAPGFKPFTKGTVFRSEMQLRNHFGSWQLWRFVKFLLFQAPVPDFAATKLRLRRW